MMSASTEMDLRMLAYCLGRERSINDLTELAHDAGLTVGTVGHARRRAIIELLPDRNPMTEPG